MKITALETIRLGEFPNLIWLRIHTDEGLIGLGESFYGAAAIEAYLHETAAHHLLGQDPLAIEALGRKLYGYVGYTGTGVEMRGNSAVDVALWDLFGKVANQPIYQLLGGASRDSIRVYNTCAGYQYVRAPAHAIGNWGLPKAEPEGPYEDLVAFLERADELAQSLLDQGISGMKIWPFDSAAMARSGNDISAAEMKAALGPFEKIRRAVGDKIDVMAEMHLLWNLPTAVRIAEALKPYDPYWIEDPIKMDSLGSLQEYKRRTGVTVTASETIATHLGYRELLERQCADVIMPDIGWCGGLTEAKKIAVMAEAYHLPVAPHDCTGPILLTASVHLTINAPNALIQETVRAFHSGWYRDLVTEVPPIEKGHIRALTGPGLGTDLLPDLPNRPDAMVRRSEAE